MKFIPGPKRALAPTRRHVLRALAGVGIGSQFEVRRSGGQGELLRRAQPTELDATEESSEALAQLARRYAPAMAFSNADIWPVDVSYTWHDGSNVYVESVHGGRRLVIPNSELAQFHVPPAQAPDVRHYIDAPGGGRHDDRWCEAWRRIQGSHAPSRTPYPPTQYVHGFWFNRDQGLLAIQYWFFYPYNDWVNRHEGDWEHITVVLNGAKDLHDANKFGRYGELFFFHDWVHEPEQTLVLGGEDPLEQHVTAFVGGRGDLWKLWRCGREQSGGSYPWPGVYSRAGSEYQWLAPSERIAQPRRFLAPEEFRLVMLPEPHRVTPNHHPHLWWLRWPLYFGQRRMQSNFPLLSSLGLDHPPKHPGRHGDWNGASKNPIWPDHVTATLLPQLPANWAPRVRKAPALT